MLRRSSSSRIRAPLPTINHSPPFPDSASPADDGGLAWPGPEPSFSYTVSSDLPTAIPAAEQSTSSVNGPAAQQPAAQLAGPTCGPALTRHAWLRPGVRRFLLAVQPHFRTVVFVRRRCSVRRCCCTSSSSTTAALGDDCQAARGCSAGASCGAGGEQGAGGCSAALLAAALPNIDPDGQFFGNRCGRGSCAK
jgi:hypothetical protein